MLNRNKNKTAGFTLIELIMVIVILGILAAVAVPKYFNLQDDAKMAAEMGVAGGVRSGIGIIHGSLITKYASNTDTQAVLREVTGNTSITAGYDSDRDGWLQRLQIGGGSSSSNLFEFVMSDPLRGGADGGSDKWIMIAGDGADPAGGSYTGPASDNNTGVADETTETGKPDTNDQWDYTENDAAGNQDTPGDGRFALTEN
jgi:prepilin-type N-terminal cleavage/methylation domain-containing protein